MGLMTLAEGGIIDGCHGWLWPIMQENIVNRSLQRFCFVHVCIHPLSYIQKTSFQRAHCEKRYDQYTALYNGECIYIPVLIYRPDL